MFLSVRFRNLKCAASFPGTHWTQKLKMTQKRPKFISFKTIKTFNVISWLFSFSGLYLWRFEVLSTLIVEHKMPPIRNWCFTRSNYLIRKMAKIWSVSTTFCALDKNTIKVLAVEYMPIQWMVPDAASRVSFGFWLCWIFCRVVF